jgi:hypothetical protein
MSFGIFIQLLKLCGAIHDFDCSPKALPLVRFYPALASLISDSLPAPKVGGALGDLLPLEKYTSRSFLLIPKICIFVGFQEIKNR